MKLPPRPLSSPSDGANRRPAQRPVRAGGAMPQAACAADVRADLDLVLALTRMGYAPRRSTKGLLSLEPRAPDEEGT